ncbi:pimeloyl-ACP methyl ester carboxylesterase [Mobilisporobacter senegalensis]|uniref:prolyl aminopeptidase n=1 Tax=Mobilisporobacter senegalensis TaxID=1329262 RepID=A0A3N1Y2F1_9FIRM|nr:alpha/beta hydrolase [Mobilisporobacter senegalensis]ROR31437.1 pimeloyl-ACP methyl ester carboxylesterase [Mobilisporobacter senegalensis]
MIKVMIFAVILLMLSICLMGLVINGSIFTIKHMKHEESHGITLRLKKNAVTCIITFIMCIVLIWFTQISASTPGIKDEKGEIIPDSISELRQVELNSRKEWISIRGNNKNNPVLLFLSGGPGGSQMAAVRHDLSELEKYFVVVNWDQPGSAKSYGAVNTKSITVATYIEDGYALTKYLCKNFHQDKIYLVGESWGSALGIFLAEKNPELYHALIGTGQMVAFLETEIIDYQKALELAEEKGDMKKAAKLIANGKPPYYGRDVTWKSAEYLQYLSNLMGGNPEIHNNGYNTFRDLLSEEYGIMDKINYLRGIINTFNHVYPQLYETDLRKGHTKIDIPVYFFLGRYDINAPASLVEEYFKILTAPEKEIIWFEHSGHSPWINESGLFVHELLRVTKNN